MVGRWHFSWGQTAYFQVLCWFQGGTSKTGFQQLASAGSRSVISYNLSPHVSLFVLGPTLKESVFNFQRLKPSFFNVVSTKKLSVVTVDYLQKTARLLFRRNSPGRCRDPFAGLWFICFIRLIPWNWNHPSEFAKKTSTVYYVLFSSTQPKTSCTSVADRW